MKRAILASALIGLAISRLAAGGKGTVTGAYVEARTAEVFTGGCIMNSEAETVGRQAVRGGERERRSFKRIAVRRVGFVAPGSGGREPRTAGKWGGKPDAHTCRVGRC